MIDRKNVELFARHGVFTEKELRSRYEITLEYYTKTINIEAETCLMMAEKQIFPACARFAGELGRIVKDIKACGIEPAAEMRMLKIVTLRNARLLDAIDELRDAISRSQQSSDALENATYERQVIVPAMQNIRIVADDLETIVDKSFWPFPTYDDLLFNV